MTEREIIKALECCMYGHECEGCPYIHQSLCNDKMKGDALELIEGQRMTIDAAIAGQETLQKCIAEKDAEIERLKTDNEQLKSDYICETLNFININKLYEAEKEKVAKAKQYVIDACKRLEAAKSEAIKEFESKVLDLFPADKDFTTISRLTVKQIAKEMVGEIEC